MIIIIEFIEIIKRKSITNTKDYLQYNTDTIEIANFILLSMNMENMVTNRE